MSAQSYILAVCVHKVFPRALFACTGTGRGKKRRKNICQHGIDHVRKNSVCILLHVCLKSQPSCWLMLTVSGQRAVENRMDYKSSVWPPSMSYTISEAALGPKDIMDTISSWFSLVLKETNLLLTSPILISNSYPPVLAQMWKPISRVRACSLLSSPSYLP